MILVVLFRWHKIEAALQNFPPPSPTSACQFCLFSWELHSSVLLVREVSIYTHALLSIAIKKSHVDNSGTSQKREIRLSGNSSNISHGIYGRMSSSPILLEPHVMKINPPISNLWLQKVVIHSKVTFWIYCDGLS